MGHAVESEAVVRGHEVVCSVDNDGDWMSNEALLRNADVAVEFSTPATAVANIKRCFALDLPVVCGTTGWDADRDAIVSQCLEENRALFTASNFSIGMNIMYAINERLATLMRDRGYSVSISETHHIHKLDAPSGTALQLANQIAECGGRKLEEIPIESIREGEVPGTHTVVYDSPIDTLTITHEAHSRKGLAVGAILAAEFLCGKRGSYTMKDLID